MRTFVAVEISDDKLIGEIVKFQSEIPIKAKPVSPENLHFTLHFLGEISEEQVGDVKNALLNIKFPKFTLGFEGVGVFPKPSFPRVIWIGTDKDGGSKLINLAKRVDDVLSPLGFKKDKPFKPHMTIFRIKDKVGNISGMLNALKFQKFGNQKVENLKFKKSVLTASGPVYSDLGVIDLK